MGKTCCCGCCTLAVGTGIALALSAVQAVLGIIWNTELLVLLKHSELYNPLKIVINERVIEDFDVVHGLTLAGIGLNGLWFIFAIIAARGNITLNHGQLTFWDILTYIITLFDIGTSIYLAVKLQEFFVEDPEFFTNGKPTKTLTYLVLLIAFSKGGLFILINMYLAHVVQMRGKEIDHDHSVLALYIISHLAKCNKSPHDVVPLLPGPPPSYASSCPYSPAPPPCERRSDSDGSTWSLSYDAIRGMSRDPPSYDTTTIMHPSIDFARKLSRDPCARSSESIDVQTGSASMLPR